MIKNALKKILRTVSLAAGALICLSLSACDNFLEGGPIKEDIQQEIENYIGSLTTINFTADTDRGQLTPVGLVALRTGKSIEVSYKMKSGFNFRGFQVTDAVTASVYKDAVSFDPETGYIGKNDDYEFYKTKLTVLKSDLQLKVSPLCTKLIDDVPPVISGYITAGTMADIEAGNNKYRITDKLCICVSVIEPDSGIDTIYVSEDNSVFKEYTSSDYELKAFDGYYKVYLNYDLSDTSGGNKTIYVQVRDVALNNSEVTQIDYYQDTIADVNFYLTNPTVNYLTLDNHTYEYNSSADTNNAYKNVINVNIAKEDIEARQWTGGGSNVMTFTLYAGKEYSPGKNGNNLYTKPADLKWSYSYSSDRDELDSKAMTSLSFAGAVESVYDYTWYKQVSVPVEDSQKVTYIKVRCQDLSGNVRDAYYELPSVPQIVSEFITTYNSGTITYKRLRVKSKDYDDNGYYYSLIFTHDVNYLTYWRAFGEDYRPSSGSALVEGDLTWVGASTLDYDSLTSADYYSQLVYKYYDYKGDEHYIYGYVSDVHTAQYYSSIPNYALSQTVAISADAADTHTITVTVPQTVYDYYDSVYAYAEGVFSCFFDEGRTKSFKVATSNFYETLDTTTRKAFKFYVVGVKNGVERSSAYTISTTNSYIHDNVAPRVLYADSLPKDNTDRIPFDYTGKYIKVKVEDTGNGFPSEQDITVRYVAGDYDVTRKIKFSSSDDAIYIPVGHLPLAKYWSSFDISFSFKDAGSITTDCSFSYQDPRYYPWLQGELNKWEYWNAKPYCYDESDINYSIVYENSSYQFRFIPGIESYLAESPVTGELEPIQSKFGNMFMGKVQASYDKIGSDSKWEKGCDATYMDTKYTGSTPWYEYLSLASAGTGFFRFFIQASTTNTRIGPVYLYQTGEQTVSIKDVVNTVNGMQVYSSKPFFIHTLWSEFNYGDDPKDWEYYCTGSAERSGDQKMEVNVKFLNSSSYSSSPYYYPILTEDVPDGCYYCAVVWFADNTCIMSTVRQK